MSGGNCTARNAGIDILKYICALLVICIHTQFAGKEGIDPLTKAAVPVFFMITGWFYSNNRVRQKKQILRILWIFVAACTLYFFLGVIKATMIQMPLREYAKTVFSPGAFKLFALFNHVGIEVHLWYLPAILYVLIIAAALGERGRKLFCWASPFLLAGGILLGAYSPLLFGTKLPNFVSRNFLFIGLPCFLLAEQLHKMRLRIRVKPLVLLLVLCLSILLTLWEKDFMQSRTGYESADIYVGSVFMAASMLLLATASDSGSDRQPGAFLADWGREYSLGVYVLHMAVIWLMHIVFDALPGQASLAGKIYFYTAPLVILAFTTALTALLKTVQKHITPHKPEH